MSNDSLSYSALGRTYTCRRLPTAHPPRAGIILLPDWRGEGPLAMQHAQHLHGLGCDVVVADLYGDGFMPSHPDQVGPMVQQLLAHRQDGVVSLTACLNAFRPLLPADTPVIVLGYSAGGMVALDLARSGAPVDGTITCSALLKTADAGMPTRIPGPVLILQGTQDVISPPDVISTVIAEMDAAGNDAALSCSVRPTTLLTIRMQEQTPVRVWCIRPPRPRAPAWPSRPLSTKLHPDPAPARPISPISFQSMP